MITFTVPRHAPLLIALTVGGGALLYGGWSAYALWQGSLQPREAQTAGGDAAVAKAARGMAEILPLHLFGRERPAPAALERSTENLPETNLSLVLRGVAAATADTLGGALVEGPDRETHFFRVGQQMPGGVVLHSVHTNRIVLDRKGKLENLAFPETSEDSGFVTIYDGTNDPEIETSFNDEPQYPDATDMDGGAASSGASPDVVPTADAPGAIPGANGVMQDIVLPDQAPETSYEPAVEIPGEGYSESAVETIEETYVEPVFEDEPPVQAAFEEQPPEQSIGESQSEAVPEGANPALEALEEARRQEIRDRLQRLREQIRQRSEG